jgi:glycosyltransferase involved in cell wall biosynthesis
MGCVSRVLLLAPDVPPAPGALAAGPGIRYGELAAVLRAAGHDVTLAAPEAGADAVWSSESVARLAEGHAAVVLGQGHADLGRAVARRLPPDLPVVVDCYAPGIIEAIALNEDPGMFPGFLARTVELLRRGDLFLVANEPQRLYTLGLLSAAGRLNPTTYAAPPLLEVPFGVPSEPPGAVTTKVGRGVLVPEDAALVLWYGGVYPWFDCATAVRGFARALERVPSAWFVIVGGRHPRAHAPDARLLEALSAARELGISERVVEAPWGPYDQRIAWYAEADCAICLHHRGLETELSHRTRLVDLLWGRVPVVSSAGDVVGERAAAAGAGITVPIGDAEAAGDALIELLGSPERREACRAAAADLAADLAWPRVLEPLVRWLEHPRVAADRVSTSSWRVALRSLLSAARAARSR